MATFYLDFEGGNDANAGTTFATRWKSLTAGATAARIAPGDEIRIMGSPAPTSLGQNAVWTSQALPSAKSIVSSTNATPISINLPNHGYSTGDTVLITGHATNTNANGTWEITVTNSNDFTLDGSVGNGVGGATGTVRLRNNSRVMLTTAVTQNVASFGRIRTAWTQSANVTATLSSTTFKETIADSIAIATNFATGKAAYKTISPALNLSGYQQLSFWIQQTAGTVGLAGSIDIRLCSDTIGATAVNTFSIPALSVTGRWMPITINLGVNLGASIQSIAFYVNTDNGAQTFLLDNIIACKASSAADSLTLTSLIGKNTTGETFWGIQSIVGRRVMLDNGTATVPTDLTWRGYYGASATVTTWKRETIKLGPSASSSTALQTIQDSGTEGLPITFSGGWDRTAMATQNLETWLDGVNGNGYGIVGTSRQFVSLNNLAGVRFNTFIFNLTNFSTNYIIAANNNTRGIFSGTFVSSAASIDFLVANLTSGMELAGGPVITLNHAMNSNGTDGLLVSTPHSVNIKVKKGSGSGVIANNQSAFTNLTGGTCENLEIKDNSIRDVLCLDQIAVSTFLINCLLAGNTEVQFNTSPMDGLVFSQKHDQTANNHKIFMNGGLISSATDQRHTASGISWKIQPTSTNRSSAWPVTLSLAKVACAANSLVTIKAWMYRDNAGLTMRLVCKGGQIEGVANDVTASVTTTNAWEEETITFTPTETGVVEITAEAWGGTTFSGWVDDMTISQA